VDLQALLAPDTLLGRLARWLRDEGVEAYLVGGSVRDALLGEPVEAFHDLDFAAPAGGMALARRLADRLGGAFFALDAARDTGRVVLPRDGGGRLYLDFARWRGDSLQADLFDRDFTVNAMALDISRAEGAVLIDPCGGQADLAARLVRAVTEHAFVNDPARTLRAVRLEAEFGFCIEARTENLLRQAVPWLARVSHERVRDELARIVRAPGAAGHIDRLDGLGLLPAVLPEVSALKGVGQSPPHRFDVYGHTLQVLAGLEGLFAWLWPGTGYAPLGEQTTRDLGYLSPWRGALQAHFDQPTGGEPGRVTLLKLAALLHDVGKPQTRQTDDTGRVRFLGHEREGATMAAAALHRLRFSRQERLLVQAVVQHHLRLLHLSQAGTVTRRAVYRFFRDVGDAGVDVVWLGLADVLGARGDALDAIEWQGRLRVAQALLEGRFDRHREVVCPPRLIGGRDLMEVFGLLPGPRLGELLEAVREAQATGLVSNRQEALALARDMIAELGVDNAP